jgi:hypothetical protein
MQYLNKVQYNAITTPLAATEVVGFTLAVITIVETRDGFKQDGC